MNTVASEPVRQSSTKWKPYPSYTDSGIEWLSRIPAHWETMPLKRAVECPVERGVGQELPFVALEHIVGGEGRLVPGFEWETADASDCATFRPGDVLYGKLRPYLRKYLHVDRDGCCPTELLVLRPATADCSNRFLYYLVQSQPFVALTEATSCGVKMPRTAWGDLSPCWVWLPPLPEQRAIAAFLDRETAKIDSLISAKERQIQLLREKRMAIISQAVTRGLDPNAPLKDSGIEWLGRIPAHWKVMRLKHGWDIRLGKMLQPQPNSVSDTLGPYLRSANIYWHGVNTSDVKEMWLSPNDKDLYEIAAGDLLVCEGGDVGVAAIWDGALQSCYIQNAIHRLRPKLGLCNEFLYYWLYTLKHAGVIDLVCNKATIAHFTGDKLGNLPVGCPESTEQRAIAAFLDRETAKIDALISRIQQHIERLREYRIALISAAVTGQIDVREEV